MVGPAADRSVGAAAAGAEIVKPPLRVLSASCACRAYRGRRCRWGREGAPQAPRFLKGRTGVYRESLIRGADDPLKIRKPASRL
jgi:hypothetical protein